MTFYGRLYLKRLCHQIFPKCYSSSRIQIDKILIANRGQIACKIIKTARRLGVRSVAVYSEIDETRLHATQADEAYNIGSPFAENSYLRGDNLIKIAVNSDCQAIHPGYGYLSDNAEFADLCNKNNIIFIGPPPAVIRDMGIKSTSKKIMIAAGVPVIEGYHGTEQSDEKLKEEAEKIGYPIMIKPIRGSLGRGMKIVHHSTEFLEALHSARSESEKAFNNSDVLLERFISNSRHVEIQIFGDAYGDVVHLFERDCSVQRRHQKFIDEAPAPDFSEQLREAMGAVAVKAAKAVGYVGGGTVEFILDKTSHEFYFMELVPRLQVEHSLTEMITGIDLIEWQIRIASGDVLPSKNIKMSGHAFQARIYAEDVSNNFLPVTGILRYLSAPKPSSTVRIETGVQQNDEVTFYYDGLLGILVVWGPNRHQALIKLKSELINYNIVGLETNLNFLLRLCNHPEFMAGIVHTTFIKDYAGELLDERRATDDVLIHAATGKILNDEIDDTQLSAIYQDQYNPFLIEARFRTNYILETPMKLFFNDEEYHVNIKHPRPDFFLVSLVVGKWRDVKTRLITGKNYLIVRCEIDGRLCTSKLFATDKYICVFSKYGKIEFSYEPHVYVSKLNEFSHMRGRKAVSPVPGFIYLIFVDKGQNVKEGDPLFSIISMKMEYIVKAPFDGRIADVFYVNGNLVEKGAAIVEFEESSLED